MAYFWVVIFVTLFFCELFAVEGANTVVGNYPHITICALLNIPNEIAAKPVLVCKLYNPLPIIFKQALPICSNPKIIFRILKNAADIIANFSNCIAGKVAGELSRFVYNVFLILATARN